MAPLRASALARVWAPVWARVWAQGSVLGSVSGVAVLTGVAVGPGGRGACGDPGRRGRGSDCRRGCSIRSSRLALEWSCREASASRARAHPERRSPRALRELREAPSMACPDPIDDVAVSPFDPGGSDDPREWVMPRTSPSCGPFTCWATTTTSARAESPRSAAASIADEAAASGRCGRGRIGARGPGRRRLDVGGDCGSCRRRPAALPGIVMSYGHVRTGDPDPIGDLVGRERDGRRDVLLGRLAGLPAQAPDDVHPDRLVDDGAEASRAALAGRAAATDDHEPEPDQPDDHDGGDEQSGGVQCSDPSMGGARVRRAASRRDATTGRRDHSFGRST